jgi:hypothetical protein
MRPTIDRVPRALDPTEIRWESRPPSSHARWFREPPDHIVVSSLDPTGVVERLGPPARAEAGIDRLAANGARVDATLTAGDEQWRVVFGCSAAPAAVIDWLDVFERPTHFDGVAGGLAIVVNGPSGAGKSMLLRALQQIVSGPLVVFDEPEHTGTDAAPWLSRRDRCARSCRQPGRGVRCGSSAARVP